MGAGAGRFQPPFSVAITKAIAIVPKVTSIPSMIGSVFIMQDVLRCPKRRCRVYHRLMLGTSCMDFLWSLKTFCSTWPYPAEVASIIYGARGTRKTCVANGFLAQVSGLSSVLYSATLTVFFLLVIRFHWREERLKRSRVEPWLHAVPLVIGWGTGIIGLAMRLFNPWTCWIQEYPPGCTQSYKLRGKNNNDEQTTDCIHGDNAGIYRWAFYYAFLWGAWVFMIVALFLIYRHIYKTEKASQKYDFAARAASQLMVPSDPNNNNIQQEGAGGSSSHHSTSAAACRTAAARNNKKRQGRHLQKSQRFATQAALYVIFFAITWAPSTVSASIQSFKGQVYSPLMILVCILAPTQGMFNAIIYLRPRWIRHCERHPELSLCQVLQDWICRRLQQLSTTSSGMEMVVVENEDEPKEKSRPAHALSSSSSSLDHQIMAANSDNDHNNDDDDDEVPSSSSVEQETSSRTGDEENNEEEMDEDSYLE